MSRRKSQAGGLIVLSVASLTGLLGGCVPVPPEAVLAGTWSVTAEDSPDLKELVFTFDSNGNLSNVTYQVGSNASISVPAPESTTEVNGSSVTISSTFLNNSVVFEGTMNSTNTVITGTLTTQITVGGLIITIDNGAATLTKLYQRERREGTSLIIEGWL
jgi:hypothetical protein